MLESLIFIPAITSTLTSSLEPMNLPSFNIGQLEQNINTFDIFPDFKTPKIATSKSNTLEDLSDETNNLSLKTIKLSAPYVNQKEDLKDTEYENIGGSACGPAALTMALKNKGLDIELKKVIDELPNSVYVKGAMFYDLTSGPKYFGYKAIQIEPSIQAIYETLQKNEPILLNVQNYDGITGHELLVVGIKNYSEDTKTATSLIVHDPFREAYREFPIISKTHLEQPEGYKLAIGTLKPFYIVEGKLASN
ncbi:C39 family peptidase [candidate division WWE3 bacterium]|nr:C39 family peptidase [candidate division WWE3 bacterium]